MLAAILIVAAAFYIRLANGPVSLDFMTGTFQDQINKNLSGMKVKIAGAIIEREPGSGVPHFRLSQIELTDAAGNLIARAPRAAIGIDESALFTGRVVPVSLDLIGPRILMKRNLDGGFELGFGAQAADEREVTVVDEAPAEASGKSDQEIAPDKTQRAFGEALIAILSGEGEQGSNGIGAIETVRVTDAAIKFYDEANDAIWDAPKAELAFRRMPYGFAVVANVDVANGNETGNWHTEVSASYRRESRSFAISARIDDLVPANISDEIFALAQLARFKVPLSGHAELEIKEDGTLSKASAEFSAAAGEVSFPDYLAEPVIVDEGSLRIDFDPASGGLIITDSQLLVGSSKAQITGNILPVRNTEGILTAVNIALNARNVSIDAEGTVTAPVAVDRIDFVGRAAINDARMDIDDLVIMSGSAGIRVKGSITGGGESPGIRLSGRIRDLSAALLKQLWPPILVPKTRDWVTHNVIDGVVTEGEFIVNLPVDALAIAKRDKRMPPNSIDLHFKMADLSTRYFKELPPIIKAEGEASLKDDDFNLQLNTGEIVLESGRLGKLQKGTMSVIDILVPETPAEYTFDVLAPTEAVIEYASHPSLNLIKNSGIDTSKLSGAANLRGKLVIPMMKGPPAERIVFSAEADVRDAALQGALPGIDITDGEVSVTVDKGQLDAQGPVKINGVPVQLTWSRARGPGGKQSAVIEATLDDDERKKIGIDLGEFIRGPTAVKAALPDLADPQGRIDIEADLSKAEMQIAAIGWSRPPLPKTTASFTYYGKGDKGRRVEDLEIKGDDLTITGSVSLLPKGGMKEARLGQVRLSDENRFALTMTNSDSGSTIAITGDSFDARPLIRSMFGASRAGGSDDSLKNRTPLNISLQLDRVYAHRGEILNGVSGDIRTRGSTVEAAEVSGTFLSGQPIVFRVTPNEQGREMRISGRDAGAAVRAANLYSKIAGGQIEFYAQMDKDASSSVREGKLVIRDFEVRNEAALAELDAKGKPKKSGPRKEGLSFKRLTLPFTTDARFLRLGDSLVRGNELGATAQGVIRKSDGAIDITGTIIPAYGPNAALGNIPVLGEILTGGGGEGIFGLTYALGGTMNKPVFQTNPVSAIAPGIFRKLFEYGDLPSGKPLPQSRNTDKSGP
ncbi:MAG: DUF3971 domain-containing protein [Hyphomicrobiales bacterium]